MNTEISKRETSFNIDPQALISQGIEKGLSIEGLQKLLDMREQLKKEYAREEFFKALSAFQKECNPIEKKKKVFAKGSTTIVRYHYAPLEDIIEQIKDPLEANGFSYSFKNKQDSGNITTVCELHHRAGHTETAEITVKVGNSGFMTDIQEVGSAMTYTKRYSFCNVTGITTGDEDDDGNGNGAKEKEKNKTSQSGESPQKDQLKPELPKSTDPAHKTKGSILKALDGISAAKDQQAVNTLKKIFEGMIWNEQEELQLDDAFKNKLQLLNEVKNV